MQEQIRKMNLLKLNDNFEIVLDKPFIATIKEFREIYVRDKTKNKEQAHKEFSFIYNFCDFSSPFIEYDEEDRFTESVLAAGLPENWHPDEDLQAAIDKYLELSESRSLKILKTAYTVIDKLRAYYRDLEFDEVDGKGQQKNKPKEVMASLKELKPLLKQLEEQEKDIKRELASSERLRGGATMGIEEDPR